MSEVPDGFLTVETPKQCKLYVSQLNLDTTDKDFEAYFSKFGAIDHSYVSRDRPEGPTGVGLSRGYGIVTYKEPASLERAHAAKPHYLDDEELKLMTAQHIVLTINPDA